MANRYLYRINGGEVEGMSTVDEGDVLDSFHNWTIFDVSESLSLNHDLPRIWDGIEIRNATIDEINNFVLFRDADKAIEIVSHAKAMINTKDSLGKIIIALSELLRKFNNRIANGDSFTTMNQNQFQQLWKDEVK